SSTPPTIRAAILAHEQCRSEAMETNRRSVRRTAGRTWLTILLVSARLIGTSGSILWWQGQQITNNYTHLRQQEDTLAKMTARTWGVRDQESSDGRRFLILPPGMQTEAIPNDGTTWISLKQE
ncbi:mobilization protein, partial [Enterobacter hormaechei subsp. xiangfangensis]